MNTSVDFGFLIEDFIESYNFYHSDEETGRLINDILENKHIAILPSYLKVLTHSQLLEGLSKVLNKKNPGYTTDILKKYNNPSKLRDDSLASMKGQTFRLRKIAAIGVATAICLTDPNVVRGISTSHTNVLGNAKLVVYQNTDFFKDKFLEYTKDINISFEKSEAVESLKKENILNNYYKCKSISDIKKRQKQLQSLNLGKSDKVYPDCKLDASIQRFIYEQSILNGWPADFTFSIIYAETNGEFTSSCEVSYNSSNNYDLGLTQQNTISSLRNFMKKYDVSYKRAYNLLKNNDYANICSAFLEYKEIAERFDKYDPYEFAGCYNGWLDWKDKEISKEYVKKFRTGYDNIFTKHHKVEKRINI